MEIFIGILVAVVANVIGYLICKWLDRHSKGKYAQRTPGETLPLRGFAFAWVQWTSSESLAMVIIPRRD